MIESFPLRGRMLHILLCGFTPVNKKVRLKFGYATDVFILQIGGYLPDIRQMLFFFCILPELAGSDAILPHYVLKGLSL